MFRELLLAMLVILTSAVPVAADYGAVTSSGGTLRLMETHPTVSLTSETILLETHPTWTTVTVDMHFDNDGDASVVQMGFPTLEFGGPGHHHVRDFTVLFAGEPLQVTVAEKAIPLKVGERDYDCTWHLIEVPFDAGEDVSLRVRYKQARWEWGDIEVPYILQTGATWKGDVRDIELQVRPYDRLNHHGIILATGPDRPRGDRSSVEGKLPLETAADGETLRWHTEDYDGEPGLLWFRASLGPAEIVRDGGRPRRSRNWLVAWWEDGRMYLEPDYLAEALMARVTERGDNRVVVDKEGQTVRLPTARVSGKMVNRQYADPQAALEEFGGAVRHSTNEQGDLVVRVTTCPDNAASASGTALFVGQKLAYRLRALRAMAECWPDECDEVCEEVLAREQEEASVLAFAVGYVAEIGGPVEESTALVERIAGPKDWYYELGEAILSATSEREFRGAMAMVPEAYAGTMGDVLVGDWREGRLRAMNAGVALRWLEAEGAAEALMSQVLQHEGRQASEDAMRALGPLGDDAAVELLVSQTLDPDARTRDINCVGAQALALLGTPEALRACVRVWRASADREVQARAFRGLKIACGQSHPLWRESQRMLPEWEQARMSVEEGRRLCRELLEGVAGDDLGESRSRERSRLLEYIELEETRVASGGR